jgi:hypothetical protein
MRSMENPDREDDRGFKVTLKEGLLILAGTALALGSFRSDDPWIVVPMLAISAVAFVWLCLGHRGPWKWRISAAALVLCVLVFIGWRDLRHRQDGVQAPPTARTTASPTINQTATSSNCANLVAGSDAQIKCEVEKEKSDKKKPNQNP